MGLCCSTSHAPGSPLNNPRAPPTSPRSPVIAPLHTVDIVINKDLSCPPLPVDLQPTNDDDIERLQGVCGPFSLINQWLIGYCVSVYDGDTCTMNIHSPIGNHQWKVRLIGFDAPELKTRDPLEKKHGFACRDMLAELIRGKFCVLHCQSFEKYGRLLADIYIRPKPIVMTATNATPTLTTTTATTATTTTTTTTTTDPVDGDDWRTVSCDQCDLLQANTLISNQSLISVNEWMLQNTPCVIYDGGKKTELTYDNDYHSHYLTLFDFYKNLTVKSPVKPTHSGDIKKK